MNALLRSSTRKTIVPKSPYFRTVCNRAGPNLVDPAGWPKIGLLSRDFGSILSVFPRKKSKTQSSLNFLQSGPPKFSKSDFSGLAPIRRVLNIVGCQFEGQRRKKRTRPPPPKENFWGNFSGCKERKTLQASGGYKNPIKTRKTISTTEISPLWPPFFSAKRSPHWSRAVYAFFSPQGGQ